MLDVFVRDTGTRKNVKMASLKSWIQAARLRTIPLAISGIIVGTTLAASVAAIDYLTFGLTLFTAILLQVLSNFANDYGDAISGIDSEEREGPSRMVQIGAITKSQMKNALILFAVLCLFSGSALIYSVFPEDWISSLTFFFLGLCSVVAAIKYTVGTNPYGYSGFGDLFVFVFFGLVAVFGSYYLQTKSFDWLVLLPASSIGFFSVGVLNVNNIRDIESDRKNGKFSIPVRIGREAATRYHMLILVSGMVFLVLYTVIHFRSFLQLIPFFVFVLFVKNILAVKAKSGRELDPFLKQMALSTLLFSLLFMIFEGVSRI